MHSPTDRTTEHFPESADGRTPATDRSEEPGLVPVLARPAGGLAGRRQLKRPHTRPSLPVRPSIGGRECEMERARAAKEHQGREGGPRHRIMPAGPRTVRTQEKGGSLDQRSSLKPNFGFRGGGGLGGFARGLVTL